MFSEFSYQFVSGFTRKFPCEIRTPPSLCWSVVRHHFPKALEPNRYL